MLSRKMTWILVEFERFQFVFRDDLGRHARGHRPQRREGPPQIERLGPAERRAQDRHRRRASEFPRPAGPENRRCCRPAGGHPRLLLPSAVRPSPAAAASIGLASAAVHRRREREIERTASFPPARGARSSLPPAASRPRVIRPARRWPTVDPWFSHGHVERRLARPARASLPGGSR